MALTFEDASSLLTAGTPLEPARIEAVGPVVFAESPRPDGPSPLHGTAPHSNAQHNGRQPRSIALEPLALRWRAELPADLTPSSIVQALDVVIVRGDPFWVSFSQHGDAFARGRVGDGPISLDPLRAAVLTTQDGGLTLQSPWTGEPFGNTYLHLGKLIRHSFLGFVGANVIVCGPARPGGGDVSKPVAMTVVESLKVRLPVGVDASGNVAVDQTNIATARTATLLAAADEEGIVLADRGSVFFTALDLTINLRLDGSFAPLALSLGGGGRAYLIVRTDQRDALWIVTREGQRLADLTLGGPPTREGYPPPTIGYDHRVYVPSRDGIAVAHPEGTWLGVLPAPNFVGASITPDDTLLVSDGGRLVAFQGDERTVLFAFAGETLRAAPVVTATGDVLCVTDKALYCLAPHS
jgi:hypothetical protein